jgi:hypothetical protein
MKYLFLSLLFSVSSFANVSPEEMRHIRTKVDSVMYTVGADMNLHPHVTKMSTVSELGNRVQVQFTYVEDMYGSRTCTFYYDRASDEVVDRSWLCN